MDEFVDILDSDGNPTGKIALKSEAHKKGWFHPTVHIWLYTADGQVLLQRRAKNKKTHPLLWDVSVAGHIGAGESIEIAAVREVEEEIGLSIRADNLKKIGVFKSVHRHSENLIDCEYHHAFLCELNEPLENLQKQESEVDDLALIQLLRLSQEISGPYPHKRYVPHAPQYYATVIKEIKKIL